MCFLHRLKEQTTQQVMELVSETISMSLTLLMLMWKLLTRQGLTKLAYTTLVLEKVVLRLSSQCVCFSFLFYGRLSSSKPDKSAVLFPGRSVKEFVEACKKATGVNIKVDYLERRPGDYAEVYSDPSKINSELNWTAHYTDLQKSLSTAWRWQKSHPNGYRSPSAMAVWSTVPLNYTY